MMSFFLDECEQNMTEILEYVLAKLRETGLHFNPDKIQIGLTSVKYCSHVISSDGLKPSPDKLSIILNMPNSTNRAEFGMITYLTKFLKNLSEISSPMGVLLRKDVEISWGSEQSEAFHKIKTIMTQSPVLNYYDQGKPIRFKLTCH